MKELSSVSLVFVAILDLSIVAAKQVQTEVDMVEIWESTAAPGTAGVHFKLPPN